MDNNKAINDDNVLSAREIFERIGKLQDDLTSGVFNSMSLLTGAVGEMYQSKGDDESEEAYNSINHNIQLLCDAFSAREETFWKILRMYEMMYAQIKD